MSKLQFSGELTIEQLFLQYRWEIFDNIIRSVESNYNKHEVKQIEIVEIKGTPIILKREKFVEWLNKCIEFFEEIEEYERCQRCVNIIADINKNNIIRETFNGI